MWIYVVVVGAVVSIGLFFLGRYSSGNNAASRSASEELRRDKHSQAATAPQKSIAILPFENLSEEKANAYFAEGIKDEILTKLAAVRDLKVISRTSTAKYQSKPDNLKTVAQELGVSTILEGAVQRAGDKVRINVQLIDAQTDGHLWAKSYDRDFKDILALLKSLDAGRRWKIEWPEFVNVVGQTEQESLFALRGERTARCFGREFAFDRAEDSFGVNALPIALSGKSGAHLRTHSVQLPVGLASFSRNDALRANLLADVPMVAFAVELGIGHNGSDATACNHFIEQRAQGGAIIDRSLVGPLRQEKFLML